MYLVKSNEEMASDFITRTCQLLPKSSSPSSDHMHDLEMINWHAILCGSQVEFYIRPLNTCITDIDILLCPTGMLACSQYFPVLPRDISDLSDMIDCYEIESCDTFPGFVRLRCLGEMKYNWKHKEYELNRNVCPVIYRSLDRTDLLNGFVDGRNRVFDDITFLPSFSSGPAIKAPSSSDSLAEIDAVHCIFCPQWPRDAETWPRRPRNNRWPTSDTISEVERNGCHVVYVQHRACRNDLFQWRLSFSVAEVILLQSWTKTQQIVYHLLRFFAKRELIKKECSKEDEVLCTYHLKTLMLWTCEETSREWWDSSPVIAICCQLLNILSNWLKRRHCPNYFIPEANLFHQPSTSTLLHQTERRVNDFRNYGVLSRWFEENYILPIIRTRVFRSLNTGNLTADCMDYILPLIEFRKVNMPLSVEIMVARKFYQSNSVFRREVKMLCSGMRIRLKIQQTEGDFLFKEDVVAACLPITEKVLWFKYYDFLLHSLQFAYCLSNGDISWECSLLVEFVNTISLQPKIVRSQCHNFPKTYTAQSSRFHFMRAQGLMENVTGLNSHSEFQLLSLMSKEFLRRSLEADGYEFNGTTTAALVYLAALHFATSEYLQAIRLCAAVLSDQTPQEEKETLNAGCLLFIDDVARIVGLCVLHKKAIDNNLKYNDARLYLDLRLSSEVFVQYLTVLSCEWRSTHLDFGRNLSDSLLPLDNYMKVLIKPKVVVRMKSGTQRNDSRHIVYRRIDPMKDTKFTGSNHSIVKDRVVEFLVGIALENMISFYSVILKDFIMHCNIVDCYRALYFYQCHNYGEMLQLCERILNEPDIPSKLKELSLANVSIIPPLDAFFDGDVQSLLGFHTLFYYLSPLNDDLYNSDLTDYSSFEQWFAKLVKLARFGLNGCLCRSYPIRYHYFLGRHFLARYLKVRCCIDCNLPYKEAMTEFASQKTNFPFELIVRRFLLRRHRIVRQCNSTKKFLKV